MEPECEATTETPRLIQDAKALMQASSVLLTQEGAGAMGAAEEEDTEFSDTEAEVNHIADFGEAHAPGGPRLESASPQRRFWRACT